VLTHERRHETIYHNWDAGGIWNGLADSDDPNHPVKHDRPGDDLPDTYETTAGTRNDNVDSCNLAAHKSAEYSTYGDNEFDAMRASLGVTGTAANDWANPGKQSTPPFKPEGEAPASALSQSSALAANAPYHPDPALVSGGSILGNYSDAGIDTDSDGLYNQLKLSVDVQVDQLALYNLVGWLQVGPDLLFAQTQSQLAPGTHTVDLLFDGSLINDSSQDGPYQVTRLELRQGDHEDLAASVDNPYPTAAYLAADFDPPNARALTIAAGSGVDTNADGLFNLLRVPVTVQVNKAGTYTLIGELDGSSTIAVARKTQSFSAGTTTVNLDFDGKSIFYSRQDGPYHLARLRILDASGEQVEFVGGPVNSNTYTHAQFQHGATTFDAASFTEQALDVDTDGDYDYLRVQFDVTVAQDGRYRVSAALHDSHGKTIQSIARLLDLTTGANSLKFDFPGGPIFANGVNGPYQVGAVTIQDANSSILDVIPKALVTGAYPYTSFSKPLISLAGNYGEAAVDTDGNGLYNLLKIHFDVLPGNAGVVIAQARLVDGDGKTIQWVNANQEVTATTTTITLAFSGGLIRMNAKNGPYQLRDLLVYHTGDPTQLVESSAPYTTQAYQATDFEHGQGIYLPMISR